jgi:hypothetical protein
VEEDALFSAKSQWETARERPETRTGRSATTPASIANISCLESRDLIALRKMLDDLNAERTKLDEEPPRPARPAFERARRGIEGGEATYAVDAAKGEVPKG